MSNKAVPDRISVDVGGGILYLDTHLMFFFLYSPYYSKVVRGREGERERDREMAPLIVLIEIAYQYSQHRGMMDNESFLR